MSSDVDSAASRAAGWSAHRLERSSPVPLHSQIADQLRTLINDGTWPRHHRVLPEDQLARELGVARGTLRKAVKALVDDGQLVQVHGRGTFVTSRGFSGAVQHDSLSLAEAMMLHGIAPETEVLAQVSVDASPEMAASLDLPTGQATRLTRLERLRTARGAPVGYFVNYIREDICGPLVESELARTSLYELIEQSTGHRIVAGRRSFAARAAEPLMAERLEVGVGAPLLTFDQVTYLDDGRAVELSEVWVRSDRVTMTSMVRRTSDPAPVA